MSANSDPGRSEHRLDAQALLVAERLTARLAVELGIVQTIRFQRKSQ
jgi:hypothetical protein